MNEMTAIEEEEGILGLEILGVVAVCADDASIIVRLVIVGLFNVCSVVECY